MSQPATLPYYERPDYDGPPSEFSVAAAAAAASAVAAAQAIASPRCG